LPDRAGCRKQGIEIGPGDTAATVFLPILTRCFEDFAVNFCWVNKEREKQSTNNDMKDSPNFHRHPIISEVS